MKHFGKMILSAVLAAGLMALPVYADNGVVGPTGAAAAETVSAEVGTAPAAELGRVLPLAQAGVGV